MKSAVIILICATGFVLGNGINDDSSQARAICATQDSEGVLVAHDHCNKYYKCTAGVPVPFLCPSKLLYNAVKKWCDWPENVDCGNRVIPDEDSSNDDNSGDDDSGNDADDPNEVVNDDPSQASTICVAKDSDGVLVAHEYCNKFYKCAAGVPVTFTCQPRLLYSPSRKWCDWPENVNCGNRIIPDEDSGINNNPGADDNSVEDNENNGADKPNEEINENPSQAPTICAAEQSDGILVAHEHCNKYYKCTAGVPVPFLCPSKLLYNAVKKWCDWPENVDCGYRVIPDEDSSNDDNSGDDDSGNDADDPNEVVNDDPSQASTICVAKDSDGVLVAHEYCNKFYKCAAGVPVTFTCQPRLLYSPSRKWCDWPENVNCGNRIIPDEDSGIDNNPGADDNSVEDNENDGADKPNEEINDNLNQAPTICSAEQSDGILVAHEHCNKFYKCTAGVPVVLLCPARLVYNPMKKWCDWPENVDCGNRVIPDNDSAYDNNSSDDSSGNDSVSADDPNDAVNEDPSQAPIICAAVDSNGVLVAHENCNKFYKCAAGAPIALLCPSKLLYNPAKKQCDWPENVDCGNRVIPDKDSANDNNSSDDSSGNDSVSANDPYDAVNKDPSQAPTICATEDSDGVLVAHENCNKFYKCAAGAPVALLCPSKLLYNPAKKQCDWPEHVECGSRVIPDEDSANDNNSSDDSSGNDSVSVDDPYDAVNEDPSQAPTICATEDSDGVLVAHENCNKFYKCAAGAPVALLCPSKLLYNPAKKQCDWPEHVDCGNRVIPDEDSANDNNSSDDSSGNDSVSADDPYDAVNEDPSQAPTICATEDSDGVLVAHENCNKFYKCAAGAPVALLCPSKLLYNPAKKQCDWPEHVDCGNRVITDEDSANDNNSSDDSSGNDSVSADDPYDAVNEDPSQAPTICATEDSDGVLVAHENCNKFYKCAAGAPVALLCPSKLLYNPAKKQCDWPEHVDCGNRVIPDEDSANDNNSSDDSSGNDSVSADDPYDVVNEDPSQASTICATEDSDGVLVAHENCNKFYKCAAGAPVALLCPSKLLYNPAKKQCDWPEHVDCGNRVIPDEDSANDNNSSDDSSGNDSVSADDPYDAVNEDPSQAPTICATEDSDGVLVAHENCNKFYKCAAGAPVALLCPSKLLYNPAKKQCDWPENVDCGNRVIPDEDSANDNNSSDDSSGNDSVSADDPYDAVNEDPSQAPTICATEDSDGVLVAHENCNKFYKCAAGAPVALLCPSKLLYNPAKKQCDWPEHVDCGNRVIPDEDSANDNNSSDDSSENDSVSADDPYDAVNEDPSQAPTICAAKDSDGVLVAHEYCNRFYKCSTGLPVAFDCQPGLVYNPIKKWCDWPINVHCGDRILPESIKPL